MFIGHYSAAFVAKAIVPEAPLPILMVSAQLMDVVFSACVLAGIERAEIDLKNNPTVPLRTDHIPLSHGFEMAFFWSAISVLLAYLAYADLSSAVLWAVALVCLSHWAIDFVVHTGDLPVAFRKSKVGLGLWAYRWPSILLELGLILLGTLVLALSHTVPAWKVWTVGSAMLVVQLVSFFTPPPSPVARLVGSMLLLYAAMTWAGWWIDAAP